MTQIKSEKAKNYLSNQNIPHSEIYSMGKDVLIGIDLIDAEEAIILAETEAHDRAVEAFKKACSCGVQAGIGPKCERFVNCGRYKCFINELNK